MNRELQLKLQAYLDGELSEPDKHRINDLVNDDPKAAALLAELTWTSSILEDND